VGRLARAEGAPPVIQRMHIVVRGAVQGVGFRPFVYRLAGELSLAGWVLNNGEGVFIEVEGAPDALRSFLLRLEADRPPRASIQSLEYLMLDPAGYDRFEIRESDEGGPLDSIRAFILPDTATCPDCLGEIFDPSDRRYQYPFTNCTNCGPRFTIIESLPYDRRNTTMKGFTMCPACRAEYEDPSNRRFHAQPNACQECGPHLALWGGDGTVISGRHDALLGAAGAIRAGKIVAVKGLGGFHLMADARNEEAVRRLRERKHREEKPLAVMFPAGALVDGECLVSDLERRLLRSAESPIVLLKRRGNADQPNLPVTDRLTTPSTDRPAAQPVASSVAPGNPNLGVMFPYTPLHHLLMRELGFPVVATSGNLSDEPICIDERDAVRRLGGIADLFLVHDRPIRRHADDSIVRIVLDREYVLRRARGYAPLPVVCPSMGGPGGDELVLAVGAHLKNAVALGFGAQAFVSQHVGDLETAEAFDAFRGLSSTTSIQITCRRSTQSSLAFPRWGSSTITPTSRRAWPRTGSTAGSLA
jgi:hydrogenase maturation protein HypF